MSIESVRNRNSPAAVLLRESCTVAAQVAEVKARFGIERIA